MNNIELDYRKILKVVILAILGYWLLDHYSEVFGFISWLISILMPFILGFMIAFVLNVLMIRFEKILSKVIKSLKLLAVKRVLSILASILLVVGVVALVITLIIPELFNAIRVIVDSLPEVVDGLQNWANQHNTYFPQLETWIEQVDLDSVAKELTSYLSLAQTGFSDMLDSTVNVISVFFNGIVNFVLGVVFALYILMSKESLKRQTTRLVRAYLPENVANGVLEVARLARTTFSNFIIGQTVEAFILGGLCTLGMIVLKLPYAPMVGSLVGITSFIPIVGAFIGGAIGVFMIFTVDYMQALIFLIFLIVLQQLEGDLIYPRVVGSSIGLPSLWVLFAVTVGGGLFGITGVLLGVPVVSVIYSLIKTQLKKREEHLLIKQQENLES